MPIGSPLSESSDHRPFILTIEALTMRPISPQTEAPADEDLFEIVDDGKNQICGVVVSVSALLEAFDQTIYICESLLQSVVNVHRLCDMDGWRYITSSSGWSLPGTGISIHDRDGRCLGADPAIMNNPEDVVEQIGMCSYRITHPEDVPLVRHYHDMALRGEASRIQYRADLGEGYQVLTVEFAPFNSISNRLLRVRHIH